MRDVPTRIYRYTEYLNPFAIHVRRAQVGRGELPRLQMIGHIMTQSSRLVFSLAFADINGKRPTRRVEWPRAGRSFAARQADFTRRPNLHAAVKNRARVRNGPTLIRSVGRPRARARATSVLVAASRRGETSNRPRDERLTSYVRFPYGP